MILSMVMILTMLLTSGNGSDVIHGGSGSDTINAAKGNDIIKGGAGSDFINGGKGDDEIYIELDDISPGVEDIIDGGGGDGDKLYLPGSSSDYSYEQIGDALANKYRLYDGDGNAVATIENVEALQFEDNLTVASALTPLNHSEQGGNEPVEIPTLSMHIDWNDVNNIDPGSNIELDGKTYSTDTTTQLLD